MLMMTFLKMKFLSQSRNRDKKKAIIRKIGFRFSSSSNLFVSKNTKDTRANYSSEYIVIQVRILASYSVSLKGDCEVTG